MLKSREEGRQGPCGEEKDRIVKQSLEAIRFVVRGMGALPGRKAMVIFSDSIPIEFQQAGPNESQPGDLTGSADTGEGFVLMASAQPAMRGSWPE